MQKKKSNRKFKKTILLILLILFKWHLRFFYFFIKLFTIRKKRVLLLSRQYNDIPLNYEYIIKELDIQNIPYKTFCKKVPSSVNILVRNEKRNKDFINQVQNILKYYFSIYKQMYLCATSKVIIIDGYNVATSLLNHKRNTKIIQLWHAHAAIKKFGYQTIGMEDGLNPNVAKILCMHKNYDYVISGSKQMNKYFSEAFNTDIKKVVDIGSPTIDYMLTNNEKAINDLYHNYPILKKKPNVLYVPTFRTDGKDNTDEIINNFDFDNFNLIVKLHPKNKNIIDNDNVINLTKTNYNTYDVIRISDYIITDYSALVIDGAIMNKKLLLYVYDYEKYEKENGINIDLFNELNGNVSRDFNELMNIIKNNKYNRESFNKFRKKYANIKDNKCTKKLIKLIKECLHE